MRRQIAMSVSFERWTRHLQSHTSQGIHKQEVPSSNQMHLANIRTVREFSSSGYIYSTEGAGRSRNFDGKVSVVRDCFKLDTVTTTSPQCPPPTGLTRLVLLGFAFFAGLSTPPSNGRCLAAG